MTMRDPDRSTGRPSEGKGRIAFYPFRGELRFPRNNREYFLSRELAARGWQVRWLRPKSGENSGVDLEWPVLRLGDLDHRGRRFFYPVYLAGRLWAAGVDVLWLSGWTIRGLQELSWTVRAARAAGVRVVYDPIDPICEYEDAQREGEPTVLEQCTERAADVYSACDLVTCVTPEIRQLLMDHGAPGERLVVARWGTDAKRFDPETVRCDFKERLGLDPDTFLVGWLGTMDRFKGLKEIIVPLAERISDSRGDVHFVIAGKGPLKPELERWAEEHPNVPVSVLGTIPYDEAPNFTGSLDAYLVPTLPRSAYAESICPVKCFDALAMGTPLITTSTSATRFLADFSELVSLVDHGRGAFLEALTRIHDADPDPPPERDAVEREYSHQAVSVDLADAIETLTS